MRNLLLPLALLLLMSAPAPAQSPPATPPAQPASKAATPRVTLATPDGPIVLELETERAPITAGNFLRYVAGRKFDGAAFYRAVTVGEGYGLVQGGTRNAPARTLKPIAHEPTTTTGLSHTDGAIAMARAAPGTAAGDFFIVVGNLPSMDADPKATGDNQGFAVFGRVAEGMDVVRRILAAPRSATAGEGVMKGQMLAPPIPITTARVTPPPAGG
ncbi:MAG: peptidylprolyl isomerase [Sphingomonas sp.]